MSRQTDQPRFQLGESVSVKSSHFVEEVRGREGQISYPPPEIARQLRSTDYFGVKPRPDGTFERVYWVTFEEKKALAPGDIDAGILPESDLEKSPSGA